MPSPNVEARLLTLHALTFLHPGTGQTTGVVDLPVQREVHTGFPMIASSGLKGSLRDKAEQESTNDEIRNAVFGPEKPNPGQESAGALLLSDARILAFPVRSLQGVFVWVTCPMAIQRLRRDMLLAGVDPKQIPPEVSVEGDHYCVSTGSRIEGPLVVESLRLSPDADQGRREALKRVAAVLAGDGSTKAAALAPSLRELGFAGRFVLVCDEDFQHLARHATQISARNALNERKTTGTGGNLWYEETLPPETLMYAFALAHKPRYRPESSPEGFPGDASEVARFLETLFSGRPYLQVGGNETVGQGWCQVAVTSAGGGS